VASEPDGVSQGCAQPDPSGVAGTLDLIGRETVFSGPSPVAIESTGSGGRPGTSGSKGCGGSAGVGSVGGGTVTLLLLPLLGGSKTAAALLQQSEWLRSNGVGNSDQKSAHLAGDLVSARCR
jgi:hypothetical protein